MCPKTMIDRNDRRVPMGKKILVTGSAGHLGKALVRTLRNQNHDVVGIDIIESDFTDHVGSIADRDFVRSCMQGVKFVIHSATLHKPHVATHSRQDFIDSNITGCLNLLEEATNENVKSFVFTSTTSTFGDALRPIDDEPAVWITEDVNCIPKNIYGITKVAAENLCQLFYRNNQLPCIILRTSRFFPEEDDNSSIRSGFEDINAKVNEMLYRRVDLEDVVSAHLLAMEKAPQIGFSRYIISATTPFTESDLSELRINPHNVVRRLIPAFVDEYRRCGWKMFPSIDRVYVNDKARNELGWQPKNNFKEIINKLKNNLEPFSELTKTISIKGYHAEQFKDGPYPVDKSIK